MYRGNVGEGRKPPRVRVPIVGRLINGLSRLAWGRIWFGSQPQYPAGRLDAIEDQISAQDRLPVQRMAAPGLPGAEISEEERRQAAEELKDHHSPD